MTNINQFEFNNKIIKGKDLKKQDAENFLSKLNEKYQEIEKKEVEKNEEELKVIELLNELLEKELKELDLDFEKIDLKKIKFLKENDFKQLAEDEKFIAFFSANRKIIVANYDFKTFKENKLRFYTALLHEFIHYFSFQKFKLEKKSDKTYYNQDRVGYSYYDEDNNKVLNGLNEAIVDLCAQEIIKKNKEEIVNFFSDSDQKKENFNFSQEYFNEYSFFLKFLIRQIANNDKREEEEILNTFIKGHFTGNMMHLRKIEKHFGDKSLRVLAKLDNDDKTDDLVFKYFGDENINKKEILKKLKIY